MDCFAPLAMTENRNSRHTFATSPRHAPERTRVTTSTPESPGVPARNGFTAYFELSPATGSFATVTCGLDVASAPGRADTTSATLTPAPRRQDHTTSPYAATSLVRSLGDRSQAFRQPALPSIARKTLPRPPHPMPNVRDDRETPLCGPGRREF